MNSPLLSGRISALAYLYDNMRDFPAWFRRLTPGQIEDIADIMAQWQLPQLGSKIVPLEETERREVLRAITLCEGSVPAAAKALRVGKTTMYNKLRQWGYTARNRILLAQASVLTRKAKPDHSHLW